MLRSFVLSFHRHRIRSVNKVVERIIAQVDAMGERLKALDEAQDKLVADFDKEIEKERQRGLDRAARLEEQARLAKAAANTKADNIASEVDAIVKGNEASRAKAERIQKRLQKLVE